jgi:fido (protein-threonine AMPylation protein)
MQENKIWEDITRHDLLPTITSEVEYAKQYTENIEFAHEFIKKANPIWTEENLKTIHGLLFHKIAPWAGKFSGRQEVIASIPGSPPELRSQELQLLDFQLEELTRVATSTLAKTRIIAFLHVRLTTMHPYRDGNGRTTRMILQHQMQEISGSLKIIPLACSKSEYIDALNTCQTEGNLAPLSHILCKTYLDIKEPCQFLPIPFRTTSVQIPPIKIEESQQEPLEIINIEKTPEKLCWVAKLSWWNVNRILRGTPNANTKVAEELWEENRLTPMSIPEFHSFLKRMEKTKAFVEKTAFWKAAEPTSWDPIFKKLTTAYKVATKKEKEQPTIH